MGYSHSLSAQSLVELHDELVGSGDWASALRAIRQAIALDPTRADLHSRRAALLARSGAPGALPAVSRAIALGDKSPANLVLKSEILLAAGRYGEAFDFGMAAAQSEVENGKMQDLVARLALYCMRVPEGLSAAKRAVQLAPNEPNYKLTLLNWYLKTSDLERAGDLAKELHSAAPKLPGAASAYAKVLALQGDVAQALSVGLESLAQWSADPELRALVSVLLDKHQARAVARPISCPASSPAGIETAQGSESYRVVVKEAFSIDFSLDGGSAAYRLAGWAHPEMALVWGIGPRSTLRLPALSADRDWNLAMTVSGCFAGGLIPKQTLRVLANGLLVADHDISRQSTIKVLIPKEVLSGSDFVSLEFDHPDYVSPKSLGVSNDDRQLAIAFFRIKCWPVHN
jgi:tetratricopeptide (TPR) repeat protein